MASMRDAAARSYADKMGRMGLATGDGEGSKIRTAAMGEDVGTGHVGPAKDGSQGVVKPGYAEGYETPEANERTMARKNRLDRPGYKRGGRVKGNTTVNVIVAPQNKPPEPEVPPIPPAALLAAAAGAGGGPGPGPAAAPMPPPDEGPPMAPLPGVPMGRKHGGRVPKMNAGAGGGLGRLEKKRAYGSNAKP